MIRRRSLLTPALLLVVLGFQGCSKTQDTAPETRIFGRAPIIEGQPQLDASPSSVSCDVTEQLNLFYKAQMLGPTQFGGTFGHFKLTVRVSDPDSIPGEKSDILLVSASYVIPIGGQANENTLVLFDDGSPIQTDASQGLFWQEVAPFGSQCRQDAGGGVICDRANVQLVSGDAVKDDGTYTRNFAVVQDNFEGGYEKYLMDCIAKVNGEWPGQGFETGESLSLRIEVVDRGGNLTTGPTLKFTTTPTEAFYTGDPCAFCVEQHGVSPATDENGACRGLSGMYGIEYPDGFCNQPLPP